MGRVVIVVPLRAGTSRDALDLLRSGPPIEIERLERSMAFLSSDEAVMVLEGPDLNPKDGRPWEDPSAWRDGARWVRCAASTPRIAATVLAWERSPDLQGVFFGPLPGPGDSEGGDALAGGVPPA
jgi:hypothetical protein